ncbi:DNA-binding transcriptional MerR regulator [Anoxybacillus tepidamans]|uniref:DNA-binding transcriptional MerR regulator n=1 Tax=Anoxybacteroides tepidamans TaxID=265948 RepID=A0A7W8IPP6_9BACL|nr:MerR family transcriptional regulator [Anoxybacillus tepidamans]MBB5323439.1 DNA-binding transcriptional MerR regulator [Anoxybacillus tepidamans]
MTAHKGKYNIKAVSNMLGIPPGTLRMWERRYQMIAPVRSESGHRLYTDAQVELLKKIVAKTKEGLTIRQAVALLEEAESSYAEADDRFAEWLQAVVSFDDRQLQQVWDHWFSLYSVEKVVCDWFPLFASRLNQWERGGKLTSAHRQFARSLLTYKLGMMLTTFPVVSSSSTALSIVGPDETDELPLLLFSVFLRLKGCRVIYIGEHVAETDVLAAIGQLRPAFLFTICTDPSSIERVSEWILFIGRHVPDVSIGLIGEGAEHHPLYIGKTKMEWEKKLHI